MKVLIACEYSGIVRDAFTRHGHNATSVDLLPSDSPGKHFQGDIFQYLSIFTEWDLLIAFPPCRYLAKCGLHLNDSDRQLSRALARDFVLKLYSVDIEKIAIENPAGHLNTTFRPPDQIISPHMFGSPYSKEICLWLKNLPPLMYGAQSPGTKKVSNNTNSRMSQEQKSKIKSKFFPEVAEAMAIQWGTYSR